MKAEESQISGGTLIFVGCLALVALGFLWFASKRSEGIEGWQLREFVEYSPRGLRPGQAARPRTSAHYKNKAVANPRVVFENEERLTIVRGSDRKIEEIIRHRKVVQS